MAIALSPKDEVTIHSVETIQEMRGVEGLESEVWGPRDTVPLSHLVATKAAGGLILAAFHKEEVVGFVYGFIGRYKDRLVLHSHMLAVKSEYRGLGLGYKLKLAQRAQARTMGFNAITWTFDPLQSRNAHLNFSNLGVTADRYVVDFYGPEPSALTALHLASDRLSLTWSINSSRVTKRIEAGDKPDSVTLRSKLDRGVCTVEVGRDDLPRFVEVDNLTSYEHVIIEIPRDITALARDRREATTAWRQATRRAFVEALNCGYIVEEFYSHGVSGEQAGIYILSPQKMT